MLFIWPNNNMLINLLDLNYTALEDVQPTRLLIWLSIPDPTAFAYRGFYITKQMVSGLLYFIIRKGINYLLFSKGNLYFVWFCKITPIFHN